MTVTSESRHLTASAVVLDPRTAKILLVHHRATGKWMFPGGHVDENEAPDQTAVREVLEETGVAIELDVDCIPQSYGEVRSTPWIVAEFPAPAKPERPGKPAEPAHRHIDLLYLATADSRDPLRPAPGEVAAARWFRIDGIKGSQFRAEVPELARRATWAVV